MAVIELVQEKTVTSEADRARRVGAPKAAAPAAEPKVEADEATESPVAEAEGADEPAEASDAE